MKVKEKERDIVKMGSKERGEKEEIREGSQWERERVSK